jgi:hypothetical protein
VTSIEGKIIRKETKVVSGISVASFAPGIYLLRIMDTEGNLIKVEKFVKGK